MVRRCWDGGRKSKLSQYIGYLLYCMQSHVLSTQSLHPSCILMYTSTLSPTFIASHLHTHLHTPTSTLSPPHSHLHTLTSTLPHLHTPPPYPPTSTLLPPHSPTSISSHCYHSPDVTVEFIQSSYTANEGDGVVLLEISKNGLSQQDVVVDVVLQDLTARGGSPSFLPIILTPLYSVSFSPFPFLPASSSHSFLLFIPFSLFLYLLFLLSLHHPSSLSVHSLSSPSVPFHLCPPLVFVHLFHGPSVPYLPRWVGLWSISLI